MDGQNFNPFSITPDLSRIPPYERGYYAKIGEANITPAAAKGYTGIRHIFDKRADGSLWYVEEFVYEKKEPIPNPLTNLSEQFSTTPPYLLEQNKIKPNASNPDKMSQFIASNKLLPRVLYTRELPLDVYENKLRSFKNRELYQQSKKELDAKDQALYEMVLWIVQKLPLGKWARLIHGTALALETMNELGKFIESDNKLRHLTNYGLEAVIDHYAEKGVQAVMFIDDVDNLKGKKKLFFDLTSYTYSKVVKARVLPEEPMFFESETDRLLFQVHQFRYEVDSVYRRHADQAEEMIRKIANSQLQYNDSTAFPVLKSTLDFRPDGFTPFYEPKSTQTQTPVQKGTTHNKTIPINLDKQKL